MNVVRDWGLGAGSRLEFRLARGPAGRPHPPQDTRASVCLTETRSCNSLFQRAAERLMKGGKGPALCHCWTDAVAWDTQSQQAHTFHAGCWGLVAKCLCT